MDWWKIYHELMFEKDWSIEQIGALTFAQLRCLYSEGKKQPEPGGIQPIPITSEESLILALQQMKAEANSWTTAR